VGFEFCFLGACSAAVVGDRWIIHGGRRPGKFNVTNQTYIFDFSTLRCAALCSPQLEPIMTCMMCSIAQSLLSCIVGCLPGPARAHETGRGSGAHACCGHGRLWQCLVGGALSTFHVLDYNLIESIT
jgi:hypothetical protein